MAVCEVCGLEMAAPEGAFGCKDTLRVRSPSGRALRRIRHRGSAPCVDCGVEPGVLHHLLCDRERCPACRGQLLACGCEVEGEPLMSVKHRAECYALLHGLSVMVH